MNQWPRKHSRRQQQPTSPFLGEPPISENITERNGLERSHSAASACTSGIIRSMEA
jgi:hypothetical protein